MATELTGRKKPILRISLGRPRWVDLLLVASLAIWTGVVILMIIG